MHSTPVAQEVRTTGVPQEMMTMQAIRTAVERCPEYADALSMLTEEPLAKRLYADAYTQLKAQHRELLREHARLREEHSAVHVKAAMMADFITYMARRLKTPIAELKRAEERLKACGSADGAEAAAQFDGAVNAMARIVADLVQVAQAVRADARSTGEPEPNHGEPQEARWESNGPSRRIAAPEEAISVN